MPSPHQLEGSIACEGNEFGESRGNTIGVLGWVCKLGLTTIAWQRGGRDEVAILSDGHVGPRIGLAPVHRRTCPSGRVREELQKSLLIELRGPV